MASLIHKTNNQFIVGKITTIDFMLFFIFLSWKMGVFIEKMFLIKN